MIFENSKAYKLGQVDVSFDGIAKKCCLQPLALLRLYENVVSIHKLINGKIMCPEF